MIAIRAQDLRSPLRRPAGEADRTALTAAGAGVIRTGDMAVFCKLVAVAPAVVRRDGRVQAAGHPADHARLGIIEQRLDEMTGQPEADYCQVLAALFGDLADVPWQRAFAVPTATVFSAWREAAGPEPAQQLQDLVLAASAAEHDDRDYRVISELGLPLGAIDGTVTRMPDTTRNRAAFGSTGTGDDSSPYPQMRDLLISDAGTRGTLGVLTGPSGGDKAEAEQALLDRALIEYAHVFTASRLWVLDRNFPGVARTKKLTAVTHVLIRLKSDIPVTKI